MSKTETYLNPATFITPHDIDPVKLVDSILKEHNEIHKDRQITTKDVKILEVNEENWKEMLEIYFSDEYFYVVPIMTGEKMTKFFNEQIAEVLKK
jgi:hypothetical protein